MRHFLDTNILLYSMSRNPAESFKRDRATILLDDDSSAISIQVLHEFYVQATRPSRSDAIPKMALTIRQAHGFSFWDSAIIAAALTLGCDRLYTEDLTDGQVIHGLAVINPFR